MGTSFGLGQIINVPSTPWLVTDDFNAISTITKKQGGRDVCLQSMQDFQAFIMQNGFIDVGFIGGPFTWCYNRCGADRVWQWLDRGLYNLEFHKAFPEFKVIHLARLCSNHVPLHFKFGADSPIVPSEFIFQRMWADHPTFHRVVEMAWPVNATGSHGDIFRKKLMHVR